MDFENVKVLRHSYITMHQRLACVQKGLEIMRWRVRDRFVNRQENRFIVCVFMSIKDKRFCSVTRSPTMFAENVVIYTAGKLLIVYFTRVLFPIQHEVQARTPTGVIQSRSYSSVTQQHARDSLVALHRLMNRTTCRVQTWIQKLLWPFTRILLRIDQNLI